MKNKVKPMKKRMSLKKKFDFMKRKKYRPSGLLNMMADFLANRLSAAGVSHVVKAPSPWRRWFWLCIILLTAVAMSTMTYRVLQEYLEYPTIMRSKNQAMKELEFPAVTLCPLNQIPKMFAREAGLHYMSQMTEALDKLPTYNVSVREKTRCLKDPLCYWSWFEDECICNKSPCDTLYCYPDANKSDSVCACSMLLCQWEGTTEACEIIHYQGSAWCICRSDFHYKLHKAPAQKPEPCQINGDWDCRGYTGREEIPPSFAEAVSRLEVSSQVADLLTKLKLSHTDDLRDVERFFIPPIHVMDNYGTPADSFILSCSFGTERCINELVTLYSPTYGKCYMFNYVGNENDKKPEVRVVKQPGKMHGLQLYLQALKADSLPLLTRELGVRIVVHDPRTIPIAAEDGVDVRPGDMTSIKLEYVEIHRLGRPWGICAKDGEVLSYNYSRDPYSQNDCERSCVNSEVFRRCHCYHPRFIPSTIIPRRGYICPTNDTADEGLDDCFLDVMADNDAGKIECNCPPACREKDYDIILSSSKLNPDFFQLVKKSRSLTMKNGTPSVVSTDDEFSLMGVQIYFNSFFVTNVDETAIYSWESLVANIGGNMGLFLGLSLVTLLEIVEFVADMISRLCRSLRNQPVKVSKHGMHYS